MRFKDEVTGKVVTIKPTEKTPEEKIAALVEENQLLKAQNKALSDRADFIEDVIAEIATQVYQ
ncbi:hypothetical protein IM700_005185 [Paenibacillus sp. DXFW5]|uniref:Uncharacterized protein n=1 Tax=Paenibacillus rhizolycopersici TaxID=2780073 RepID=A0ABS2H535_9BACL|nr:hypothetical protein [Paenibacillus rhizolycopersici]MBM6995054.1 hypothetical protein [Paenibacillus rhizolycopersici]